MRHVYIQSTHNMFYWSDWLHVSALYPGHLQAITQPRQLDRFSEDTQIPKIVKFRPLGAELFHADTQTDGRTDMTKVIAAFCNFANESKSYSKIVACI